MASPTVDQAITYYRNQRKTVGVSPTTAPAASIAGRTYQFVASTQFGGAGTVVLTLAVTIVDAVAGTLLLDIPADVSPAVPVGFYQWDIWDTTAALKAPVATGTLDVRELNQT